MLLSAKSWTAAVKLQGWSSENEMWKETKERWEWIQWCQRCWMKGGLMSHWLQGKKKGTPWNFIQLFWLRTHLTKLHRLTHSCFNESTTLSSPHRSRVSQVYLWVSWGLCTDLLLKEPPANRSIYIGQHRDTDLDLEAVFLCQNTTAALGENILAVPCLPCFQISA